MLVVPAVRPINRPAVASIEALTVLLLLHSPPSGVQVIKVVCEMQAFGDPKMPDGVLLTVTTRVVKQLLLSVYEIVEVPSVRPQTEPETAFIVAFDVLLLLQEPPAGLLASEVPLPTQAAVPVIVVGTGNTVSVVVL